MAAKVQNPPTVDPANANCRSSRRAFRDGTAAVPLLVRLGIMFRRSKGWISCTARAAASSGVTHLSSAQFDVCKSLNRASAALVLGFNWKGRFFDGGKFAAGGCVVGPVVRRKKNPAIPFWDLHLATVRMHIKCIWYIRRFFFLGYGPVYRVMVVWYIYIWMTMMLDLSD